MDNSKATRMGTAPVLPLILKMSLPAILSMLAQSLYNIVDSIFISWDSEAGLTAVSLAFPIQMLCSAVGVGTAVGINSLVARRLGEQRQEDADNAATHGLILAALSSVPFILFGIFFSGMFFSAYSSDAAVIAAGKDYLSVVTIFCFGVMIEMACEKTLQATGNMIAPMISKLIGTVTNIVLDPIMIFGLLGCPRMGAKGAAIATVAGQILAMLFMLTVLLKGKHAVHIEFKGFRFHGRTIKDIYIVGFPSIIMQAIGSVMTMGLNGILAGFSDMAVSVLGIYNKLQSFVFMPIFGLNQGVMPIMGYNYGAQNKERTVATLRYATMIAALIMAVGTVLFWAIPDLLLEIFDASDEMLRVGVPAFRSISICFIPAAFGIAFSTLFQAVGNGFKSMMVSLFRQLILLLPAAYILAKIGGLEAVWYAFPVAEAASLLISIIFLKQVYNSHIKTMGASSQAS